MTEIEKNEKIIKEDSVIAPDLAITRRRLWKPVLIITGIVLFLILAIAGFVFGYLKYYESKIYPGIYVGGYPLGGLTKKEAVDLIENLNNRFSQEGIELLVTDKNGQENKIKLNTVMAGDNPVELARLDSGSMAEKAYITGRSDVLFQRIWLPLKLGFFSPLIFRASVQTDDVLLLEVLRGYLSNFEDNSRNATVVYDSSVVPNFKIIPEKTGYIFDYEDALTKIKNAVSNFSFVPISLKVRQFIPTVSVADVEPLLPQLSLMLEKGPMTLVYTDQVSEIEHKWVLNSNDLLHYLEVRRDKDNRVIFTLDKELIGKYLNKEVRLTVDIPAREAKFVIENEKVKEFQGSRFGISMDNEKTYEEMARIFEERNYALNDVSAIVKIAVNVTEPQIKTADVAGFGISDVIGVGISTFRDSHTNRIKNIANAVARLNGTLIKPGEEFSTIIAAGPFTAENGFLPEMVIKGKEIKPEVGGGMCQIGTTLFRMAMNSGMPITERRNHSLVVSYYADPVNGNPGTDATIYEPILDFKFLNDTGNYLLLQTDINYKKQQLTFTLWGKSDGRKGWYTNPIVSRWIKSGEPEDIYIDNGTLKPGEKKCQAAFPGAVASFTFSRVTPTGEKIDRVFDSYYRPLPKICMIGVEKGSCAGTKVCGPPANVADPALPAIEVPSP